MKMSRELAKVNNRFIGENSPNLVTLFGGNVVSGISGKGRSGNRHCTYLYFSQLFGDDPADVAFRVREARISFVSGHSSFAFQVNREEPSSFLGWGTAAGRPEGLRGMVRPLDWPLTIRPGALSG
jgi:hypothetical protein